jgi:hypothetical protein
MGRTVAIHQPNFLPWLGWFDKLDRSDAFVLLDSVQLQRQSATTRVSILQNGCPLRLSVPVRHVGTVGPAIRHAELDVASPRFRKIRKSLYQCYGQHPFWTEYGEPILQIVQGGHTRLLDLNLALLRFLAEALGIDWAKVQIQSNLRSQGRKNELVATLTQSAGGDRYLSGGYAPGPAGDVSKTRTAADYNDPAVYAAHGIELEYQDFVHPEYDQGGNPFVPGLSALDALVRLGPRTMELVREANGR